MKWLRPTYLIGLSVIVGLAATVACGGDEGEEAAGTLGTASVIHQWTGEVEAASFKAMVAPWEQLTGGAVDDQATRDITAIVTTRVEGGNPPDIAVLSQPGLMQRFAKDGKLVALDSFLDMNRIRNDYSQAWIDLCTVDGKLYCTMLKVDHKAIVWYNPKQFSANGWRVPSTWDEMIALSDQIVAAGKNPWSMGVESGGASGWPGTDWVASILLAESGPEVYNQWVNHQIPATHPAVTSAWEKFGQMVHTEDYIPGGPDFALSTGFVPASYLLYESPPKAFMYHLAGFIGGEVEKQFPDLVVQEDYDYFLFPTINPQYAGAVTGSADIVVMFNDNESARSLMGYLSSGAAQQIWVSRGGFTSANKTVSLENYGDPLARKVAEQLTTAKVFGFDIDDSWGGDAQATFWQGVLEYVGGADLGTVLKQIEAAVVEQLGPLP